MTTETFSSQRTPATFAEAFRLAIQARGTTLARLHTRLVDRGNPVSMATLSYWRSGARRPEGAQSLAAIADLEQLLDLDAGALSELLGPSLRTGPLGPTAFPFEDPTEARVREAFQAMGATYPDPTRELTIHSVTDVGADGRVRRRATRMVVQATSGVVGAIPFVELTTGTPTSPPTVEALGGGRISAQYTHESNELHGFLFELERPLTTPESALIEWAVIYPSDTPSTDGTGHGVSLQSRELLLWTRFDPDAVPDWCEEIEETSNGKVVTPRELNGARSLHAIRRGFGPGSLSIRWGYGERPDDD